MRIDLFKDKEQKTKFVKCITFYDVFFPSICKCCLDLHISM